MDFSTYWDQADAISRSLYFVLIAMSIASWIIFILRLIHNQTIKASAEKELNNSADDVYQRVKELPAEQRKQAIEQGLLQFISRTKTKIESGVSVIGSIASIAPFVGLFGTVWGIFHALIAVGKSGQAGLGQVALPVGEALIMTGFGLAVAIPAIIFYNICIRSNNSLLNRLHDNARGVLIDSIANDKNVVSDVKE